MLICDFHVHLHACFDVEVALDSAFANISRIAGKLGAGPFDAVLFLADGDSGSWFGEQAAARLTPGSWRMEATGEATSMCLVNGEKRMYIVQGWQGNTQERLEFLALGAASSPEEGRALAQTLTAIREDDAQPVVPWGAGKWLGRRGAILAAFLEDCDGRVCLGDNGGRPIGWGESRHFRLARRKGLPILPGTDPLPIASEARRIGTYCGVLDATLSGDGVSEQLRRLLGSRKLPVRIAGSRITPLSFIRHQLQLRMLNRSAPSR